MSWIPSCLTLLQAKGARPRVVCMTESDVGAAHPDWLQGVQPPLVLAPSVALISPALFLSIIAVMLRSKVCICFIWPWEVTYNRTCYMRILLAMLQSLVIFHMHYLCFSSWCIRWGNGRPLILGRKVLTVFHYMSEWAPLSWLVTVHRGPSHALLEMVLPR